MPLIMLSGFPSSGKTTRANELANFFKNHGKEVFIVSEYEHIKKAGFEKNAAYTDPTKEKHVRNVLMSEVRKLISRTAIVILDGANYIKGFRYELHCLAKGNQTTQCTVQPIINGEAAWKLNEDRTDDAAKYTRETFDALIRRYEAPDSNVRWDSPLFTILPEHTLNFDNISASLFEKRAPKPNQSTQNAPLQPTSFLYELDKITKQITLDIVRMKTLGQRGEIKIPDYDLTLDVTNAESSKLIMLRRQYINYSRAHAPEIEQVPQLYIQFLRTALSQ